jgi:hypothetical protein
MVYTFAQELLAQGGCGQGKGQEKEQEQEQELTAAPPPPTPRISSCKILLIPRSRPATLSEKIFHVPNHTVFLL